MEIISEFYDYVFDIQDQINRSEQIIHFCGIISNMFTTEEVKYLEYLITPELRIVEFLNKCLLTYQEDDYMLSEILHSLNNIIASSHTRAALSGTQYIQTLKNYSLNNPNNCSAKILHQTGWGLSNYCLQKFEEEDSELVWIIEAIHSLLTINENLVKSYACLAIQHLTDNNEIGELIVQKNIWEYVLDIILNTESEETKKHAVMALGGISSSEVDCVWNKLITQNVFEILLQVIKEEKGILRNRMIWVVGNITGEKNI